MRRFFSLLLVFVLSFFLIIPVTRAKEATLNELLAQARANREAYNEAKSQKALTEQEREKAIQDKLKTLLILEQIS